LALLGGGGAVCSGDEQFLDDPAVAVVGSELQRGEAFDVDGVELYARLSEQVLDYLIAACEGGPVEGGAEFGVAEVEVEVFVVEVQEGAEFVALGGQVEQAHFHGVGEGEVGLELLEYLQHADVAAVGCVVGGGVAFGVGLVEEGAGGGFDLVDGVAFVL
jgi:hypothetical protein